MDCSADRPVDVPDRSAARPLEPTPGAPAPGEAPALDPDLPVPDDPGPLDDPGALPPPPVEPSPDPDLVPQPEPV
jgi:hypothetical protein